MRIFHAMRAQFNFGFITICEIECHFFSMMDIHFIINTSKTFPKPVVGVVTGMSSFKLVHMHFCCGSGVEQEQNGSDSHAIA